MKVLPNKSHTTIYGAMLAVSFAISGCGGGGGGSPTPPPGSSTPSPTTPSPTTPSPTTPSPTTPSPTTPSPSTKSMTVRVIDGPIQGAVVCLDKNSSGVCDTGEPTATTDASGHATLSVASDDLGKFPVVAMIGTNAVDADSGPVKTPYIMAAPAQAPSIISPLTTLVVTQMQNASSAYDVAEYSVRTHAGLTSNPDFRLFTDYTTAQNTEPDAALAAMISRITVAVMQNQSAALNGVIGTKDISGATINAADVARAINTVILGSLPAVSAAAVEPSITGATSASAKQEAIVNIATSIVKLHTGIDAKMLATLSGVRKLSFDTEDVTYQPTAFLRGFTFTDQNNWYYHTIEASYSDNIPTLKGFVYYTEIRKKNLAGTVSSWSFADDPARENEVHWNGGDWVNSVCGLSSQTLLNTLGISTYNFCDRFEQGVRQRVASLDISGKSLSSVVQQIRGTGGSDSGVWYSAWGPSNLNLLGSATFPAGSKLSYQVTQALAYPDAYDVDDKVSVYSAAVAAGGDASSTPSPACAQVTSDNDSTYKSTATTLTDVITRNPGLPCNFGSNNAWWSNSTASLGTIPNAIQVPPPAGYSSDVSIRVGFSQNSTDVTFYSCLIRTDDGSARNCTAIGNGVYSVSNKDDAIIMRFSKLPFAAQALPYTPMFIARSGVVYAGYQKKPGKAHTSVRLNMTATNALFSQLGVPLLVGK